MSYILGKADVAVIGAGHAGIEAALAAARLGMDTVCFMAAKSMFRSRDRR